MPPIDNATIEKLIEKAKEAQAKNEPTALDTILHNARLQRLKTPNLSRSGVNPVDCGLCCGESSGNNGKGQGPYLILGYNTEADRWNAQSTKNPQEIFLGELTSPGLIAPGFILPGWHVLGEPYGFLQPRKAGKPFEPSTQKEIEQYITVTVEFNQRITGRG